MRKLLLSRKITLVGLIATLIVAAVMLFVGCGSANLSEIAKNAISELHLNYFSGKTQNYTLAMWSGLREEPYSLDGVKGELVQFCVLSIVPDADTQVQAVEYTAEINGQTYSGEFERSPFDRSFASDLKIALNETDEIFIYLILNGETEIAKLNCISSQFAITSSQALDIAVKHFSENVDACEKFALGVEGQCKIISTDLNLGIYFWYVSFFNAQGERVAAVIDTKTGEIVADM